ncbi:sensor histidine kinase [Zongyangia hominis]|uniref:histidine kinase n=1 Tax=Zongyangia hominis TaxID=2763677 RepID=A0A926EF08_9FIRM|nr:HAMP domain-containing sensor histidine kinase [Zongyangia hominis]MBC8570876.1 HAMP domain-containing histidine kinase [Zongyangia hominis]
MLRNREIGRFVLLFVFLATAGTAIVCTISPAAGAVAGGMAAVLLLTALLFTRWRYREISRLSEYLQGICAGQDSLDIRDSAEGELSILKSDIYKMALMLTEKTQLLTKDKRYLAEALSDISHQLKTPLTSMMVMTDLLSERTLTPEKRMEFTDNIRTQLERIEWLVTSLLKLSKIDAGAIEFKEQHVQVKDLINRMIFTMSIPVELREIELKTNVPEDVYLVCDLHWTAEALINIFKNCVEHSRPGGHIGVDAVENPIYTQIRIWDDGEGIDKEDLPHIFERFYRGKNASDESVGIGLAMARSIFVSQHGNVQVKSQPGLGTCFTIRMYKQVI